MKHRIVTAAQMKAIEQAGNAHGLPYLQMMENAGLAAYAELKNVLPQPGSLLVVCGKGNNGGNGFVIARAAAKEGWKMGGGHPARYLESVARLQQLRQMPVTELLSYKNRPLRADPDLAFRVSARRGLIVLSEFCRPQAMQIAVGIDRHRCRLARMEITDVAALRRFHIEPLDMVDIHHRMLHRAHRDGEGAAGTFGHRQMLFSAGFHGIGDQFPHLFAAAEHRNACIVERGDEVTTVVTDVKLCTHIEILPGNVLCFLCLYDNSSQF